MESSYLECRMGKSGKEFEHNTTLGNGTCCLEGEMGSLRVGDPEAAS